MAPASNSSIGRHHKACKIVHSSIPAGTGEENVEGQVALCQNGRQPDKKYLSNVTALNCSWQNAPPPKGESAGHGCDISFKWQDSDPDAGNVLCGIELQDEEMLSFESTIASAGGRQSIDDESLFGSNL